MDTPPRADLGKPRSGASASPASSASIVGIGATLAFLIVASIYFLLPFYWLIVSSTKSNGDLFGTFGLWFSNEWDLGTNLNQVFTFSNHIYVRWLLNTMVYAGGSALIGTAVAAMTGYALAKYVFRGRDLIFTIILSSVLVPATALVLPLYLLMSAVGLTNTYWSVLLPSVVNPFGVYLARIYAATSISDDLLGAARVDGSGEFRTFATIALRIMSPALVTIFLFQFVAVWSNYFLPLVMLNDENLFPVTVGLQIWNSGLVAGGHIGFYNLVVTGSLVTVIPLIVMFLLLQRFWVSGLTTGSILG
jgi:multiple sugar transport system permease protein